MYTEKDEHMQVVPLELQEVLVRSIYATEMCMHEIDAQGDSAPAELVTEFLRHANHTYGLTNAIVLFAKHMLCDEHYLEVVERLNALKHETFNQAMMDYDAGEFDLERYMQASYSDLLFKGEEND